MLLVFGSIKSNFDKGKLSHVVSYYLYVLSIYANVDKGSDATMNNDGTEDNQ